jgi:hypothetical protein
MRDLNGQKLGVYVMASTYNEVNPQALYVTRNEQDRCKFSCCINARSIFEGVV